MDPVISMVTAGASDLDALVARVGMAARAGVHLIQVRERTLDGGALRALVAGCVDAVKGTAARVVVNDRLDVALAAGAHGVHLRADSFPSTRVRALVPRGFLVGRSVHDPEEIAVASADGSVDYFLFGTVFPSPSKPGRPAAGVERLARAAAGTPVPLLAIGGVTVARLPEVRAAGAAGFAAMSLFAERSAADMADMVREARLAYARERSTR